MSKLESERLHDAFEAFKTSLADLENFLITSRDLEDVERAAGYRLILGINKWVMDRHFLGFDPQRPRFIRFMDEFSQWGLGNPDNTYVAAHINGTDEYLITGERGTTTDICIEMRSGIGRKENGEHSRTLGFIDADSLAVDAEGGFTIHVGGEQRGDNHLPQHPDAEVIFVRHTFGDWDREIAGQLSIERLGAALAPAPAPSAEFMASQIENAARRLNFIARINDAQIEEFRRALQVNRFAPPAVGVGVKSKSGFFPGQHNALAWWELAPQQALIVSLAPPNCRYLGFMLGHPLWFAALDFENRQNSLNLKQAQVASDGLVHYVIAANDPGVPNWIDPGHLRHGFMFFRCQGLRGEFGVPEVRVIAEEQIRASLPRDTPVISAQERCEVLKRRRIAVHKRSL